jgi:hypothetical protein
MDIEGAEDVVFRHSDNWIRKVDVLFVEIHNCWKDVFAALAPTDYSVTIRGEYLIIRIARPHT